jgi:hypothetical protein
MVQQNLSKEIYESTFLHTNLGSTRLGLLLGSRIFVLLHAPDLQERRSA